MAADDNYYINYDQWKTATPKTSGEGINEALEKNLNEFKAETAVWLHDLEFPEHGVLTHGDFARVTEIKMAFDKFKEFAQKKMEEL
jgi:hypothetical protein